MIRGVTWLLACQLVGEVAVRLTDAPVPGPVVGMLVLFLALSVRRPAPDASVFRAADGLLRHLQLLFIPAGVGVVAYLGTIRDQALPIVAAMALSWVLGILAVGWVSQALVRR